MSSVYNELALGNGQIVEAVQGVVVPRPSHENATNVRFSTSHLPQKEHGSSQILNLKLLHDFTTHKRYRMRRLRTFK